MTTIQTTAVLAVTAGLVTWAAYIFGTTALHIPWVLALSCVGFVVLMWREAWRRRDNPEVSEILIGYAAGVAGMFLMLAEQMMRLAEHARACTP